MRYPGLFSAASLGVLVCAGAAQAQAPAPPVAAVDEVVVTAAPYGIASGSATSSIEVMNRGELQLAPPSSLGDMVAGLPGLRSTSFGPGAGRPVIRGLSGPRVLVLTNGIGQVDASALSPDHQVASDPGEAERIEVLRGPAALLYGGSAIGGVVNVIDGRIADSLPENGVSGRLSASASDVDDGRAVSGGAEMALGPFVLTVDGQHRESEDYRTPVPPESARQLAADGEPPPGREDSTLENSAVELSVVGAGLSYVGERGFFGASVKHTDTAYGVPGHSHEDHEGGAHEDEGDGEGEDTTIDLKQTRYDLRGELRADLGPFDRVRFSGGHATYEHSEIEGGVVGTRFSSRGTEGRLEFIQTQRGGWQGAFGAQGLSRLLDAQGEEAYVPRTDINELGVFTMQRVDLGGWGFEGGLRLDRRRLESLAADRAFTNVSATAGVFLRPSVSWFLGLSLSRTGRAPTESELFANGPHVATRSFEVGDAGLRSEVAYTIDAAGHYEKGRLTADLHLFAAKYDRFIDLKPTGAEQDGLPVFAYSPTDADFLGAEAEMSYRAWSDGSRHVNVEAAADVVRAKGENGRLARIPPPALTMRAVYEAPKWSARAEVRNVWEQNRVAAFELPTDGYTQVNAFIGFRPWANERLTLFLDARNLTDAEIREHVSVLKDLAPQPGRSFRVGLSSRF